MKIHYDKEADALYIHLGSEQPEGASEVAEGVNIDLTSDGKLVGIEILEVSKKIDLNTILTYSLELDKSIIAQNPA